MTEFLAQVADVLEVAEISPLDDFHDVPMWGSLTAFALAVMLDQRYGKAVKPGDFAGLKSVADLAAYAGVTQ